MELRERNQETLKEKLKAKWQEKDFTPKANHVDKLAMSFFGVTAVTLLLESLLYLIPQVFPESRWSMSFLTFFIFSETVINWHRSYFDTANYVKADTVKQHFPFEQSTPPNWRACFKCQVDAPPRSHHCNYCGKCILKREQHCFLTGSCIGFYNQKFFVMFCFWSAVATMFSIYLQISYLHADVLPNLQSFIVFLPPVTLYQFVFGNILLGQAFLIVNCVVCLFLCFASLFFLLWQVIFIIEGRTSHEIWKRIFIFKGYSTIDNIKSVFGSILYIPVLIFIPYPFEQLGDGVEWKLRCKRVKGH